MTRLRDLPVTVVIVASIGVSLLSAVGLVTWASLDIAPSSPMRSCSGAGMTTCG